jgi:predicted nucleotidyltransferase
MFKKINRLSIFFEEPEREFHLREIARIIKKNPVTVKKILKKFIIEKVLNLKKERGFHLYSSNTENQAYKEIKRQYNRDKLINSGLVDFLKKEFNLPTVILFGSYEKGEDNRNSDIDICIITETKKQVSIEEYEKIVNRKIQLHIFRNDEFKKLRLKNKRLFNNIINGYKIYGLLEI